MSSQQGMYNADILVIDRAIISANNRSVVARVGEAFTLKRLQIRQGKKIFLKPENLEYTAIEVSGSPGIGGDIARWTPQELEEARGFIARYKQVRSTIQNGLLYRLCSIRKGHIAAAQYVTRDGSEVVVFVWGHSQQFGETQLSLALRGLKEDVRYADTISGATYSGAYLTHYGLPVNLVGDFDSRMIHLVCAASS